MPATFDSYVERLRGCFHRNTSVHGQSFETLAESKRKADNRLLGTDLRSASASPRAMGFPAAYLHSRQDAAPTARRGFPPHPYIRGRMPLLRLDEVSRHISHSRQDAAPTARWLLCLFSPSPLLPCPPKKRARALLLNPCYFPATQHLIIDNILHQLFAFSFPAGPASRRA